LERRPNRYTARGKEMKPVLILIDEFPRIGKMNVITTALTTLRIKKVTVAIFMQSLSQLDMLYGAEERRVIMENCGYLAVLSVNDPDTQRYLSQRIGEHRNYLINLLLTMLGWRSNFGYEPIIRPSKLSSPNKIKLLTPEGFCKVKKMPSRLEREIGTLEYLTLISRHFAKMAMLRQLIKKEEEMNYGNA